MRAPKSLLLPLLLPFLLLLEFGAASSAFRLSTPTQTSEHYKKEGRVRLEPDVPDHAFGRARHFVREGRVTPTDMLRLQIVLRHDPAAVEVLESTLLAVSDPRNTRYGQYLSIKDISDMVGPDPSHAEAVRAFFLAYDILPTHVEVNKNRDIITVRLPAMLAEDIFETMLYRFRHTGKVDASFIRAINPYSLPASIAPLVAYVSELIRFPAIRDLPFVPVPHAAAPASSSSSSSSSSGFKSDDSPSDAAFQACGRECAGYITPQVLSERYNLPASLADPCASHNSIALAEFQFQYYDRRDLFIFANTCGVDSVSVEKNYAHNAAIVCTRGGGCIESLLDIEWANVAAGGGAIPLSVYYSMQYSILDWVSAVNDNDDAELVHSVSYGNDELQQISTEYMLSVNAEFMKAGARGISIFIASGDQGVYGREGPGNSVFHPDFPASSPWVTSVGGTDFVTPSVVGEEMAW
jgi:tripeptidyl-peptidase-1